MMKPSLLKRGKTLLSGFTLVGLSQHFLYSQKNPSYCKEESKRNHFSFGIKVIPHPDKVYKGGEDAYFANNNVLAVADGVGGWAEYGVDPALYSKELCKHVEALVNLNWNKYKVQPKQLLIDAAEKTKSMGSSTLCILHLDEEKPVLYSSYIGDSGYLVLRKVDNKLKVVYQSQDHQRSFNFPYQIGTHGDPSSMALKAEHNIQDNDIVVVATDGLFDNMNENQIIEVVAPFIKDNVSLADPSHIANLIAQTAFKYSIDENYNSPFTLKARKAFLYMQGGKSDDITVLVGQIKIVPEAKEK